MVVIVDARVYIKVQPLYQHIYIPYEHLVLTLVNCWKPQ